MTVAPGHQPSESLGPVLSDLDPAEQARTFGPLATRQICPFLTIDGGGWRSSSPSRDHRCGGVTPPVPLALDKQRRLCLTDTHLACATFLAATGASPSGDMGPVRAALGRPGAGASPTVTRWSLVRTAPVVLDRSRVPGSVGAIARNRRGGQLVLAGLLVAAFAAVAFARLSGSGGPAHVGAVESIAPTASAAVTPPAATSAVEPSPAPTPVPTVELTPVPTVEPTAVPTPVATAAPSTPVATRTYTVKSGDTLSRIASQFGTTIDAIVQLNNLPDRNRLRVGQVLKIP
ncbi:MAG: LysM peptidoglycan-binding domain-containing protein [Chloroflexota bacterium]|nr:LysM peptidoglycan-binding domain-containing protein [Chloroflexota bacterium]